MSVLILLRYIVQIYRDIVTRDRSDQSTRRIILRNRALANIGLHASIKRTEREQSNLRTKRGASGSDQAAAVRMASALNASYCLVNILTL